MASITGAQTSAAVQIATTWGTAAASGAGDKFAGEISHSLNEQELVSRAIGSGNYMITAATRGNEKPTVNLTMDVGYRNTFDVLLAQFMGTAGAPTEVTGGQADYKHTLTFNTSLNSKYITFAYESSSAKVHEFPTCGVRSASIRTPSVPGYVEAQFELVANKLELSTAVNTNAVLQAATATDTELAAVSFDDTFWINTASGGAVSSGDALAVTSWQLDLERPQDSANEIKGSAGNGSPIATDLFSGTLTITLKELADHTYYTIWSAETAQKCKFTVSGSQIGSGTNKSVAVYIPRMQLISAPSYSVTSNGTNAVTYTFRISKASANPTGMSSTYPYFEITNGLSTSLLA